MNKDFHNFKDANVIFISALVLLIGLTVALGWLFDIPFLLNIIPGAPTMKFNTALLFVLSSLGILTYFNYSKLSISISLLLGLSITLLGFSSLLQYGLKMDLGIDNYFFKDISNINFPGRMSRTTALCFGVYGLSLIFLSTGKKKLKTLTNYGLAFLSIIAILALLTYALQAITEKEVLIFNSMAFHTAICFFLLSYGLSLSYSPYSYINLFTGISTGSRLARRLIPFLIFLPLILGFIIIYVTDRNGVINEVGITIYTICIAFLSLLYTTWLVSNLNKEDKERRELEQSLFETNRELKKNIRFKRQLVRTSPETILIINLNEKKVRYINKDIYPEAGLSKKKILGMPYEDLLPLIHPGDQQKVKEFHKRILTSGDDDVHDIEVRSKISDQSYEWYSLRGKVFNRLNENWVKEYVILARNITAIKKTQKDLISAEKFSILGEVARTLAHELRNPITSISMSSEMIDKKLDEESKQQIQKYLDILNRSTTTLNDLVTNILNASNYSETSLCKIDLIAIIENALEKAQDRIYLSGLEVKKDYSGSHIIYADKEKLEIAILNIIINASEAIAPGEGIIKISVNSLDQKILLTISDNGSGLEEEQLNRLFNAFYTTKIDGVGVGLSSVKNILDEHQATVEVKSKKGIGTTFNLYFPALIGREK